VTFAGVVLTGFLVAAGLVEVVVVAGLGGVVALVVDVCVAGLVTLTGVVCRSEAAASEPPLLALLALLALLECDRAPDTTPTEGWAASWASKLLWSPDEAAPAGAAVAGVVEPVLAPPQPATAAHTAREPSTGIIRERRKG